MTECARAAEITQSYGGFMLLSIVRRHSSARPEVEVRLLLLAALLGGVLAAVLTWIGVS